jgi:hypothetical protein
VISLCYRDLVLHIYRYIQYVLLMPRGPATQSRFLNLHRCFLYLLHMLLESRYIVTIKPFMLLCASMLQIYTCFINLRLYASYVYMDCCKHASYICLHVWTSYSVSFKNYYMVPIFFISVAHDASNQLCVFSFVCIRHFGYVILLYIIKIMHIRIFMLPNMLLQLFLCSLPLSQHQAIRNEVLLFILKM